MMAKLEGAGLRAIGCRVGDPDGLLVQPRRDLHLPHDRDVFIAQATNTRWPWGRSSKPRGAAADRRGRGRSGGCRSIIWPGRFLGRCNSGHRRGAVLGVDRFMGEARAVTNLIGNGVATVVVGKWEGALDDRPHAQAPQQRDGRRG